MTTAVLTDEQFERLRSLLARLAGLAFEPSRRDSLGYCVAERRRATGAADVDAYLELLDDPGERQHLLDEVTIQETHFFRNPPQMRALRTHVLPELLRAAQDTRRLRIWSAGCSTGEEPYTIAMMLRELLPTTDGWDLRVLGTDVSARALAAARTARYGPRSVQLATPDDLARHFTVGADGAAQVRDEVRELVEFRHHNLVTEPLPWGPGGLDLVLCRNVTIYFARDTTRALMQRLHTGLRDGGYLFLGHSETLWQVSDSFHLVPLGTGDAAAFVYRRLDRSDGPAGPDRTPRGDGPARQSERRTVLPDRRTLGGGLATEAERRRGARRGVPTGEGARAVPAPRPTRPPGSAKGSAEGVAAEGAGGAAIPAARAALAQGRYEEVVALAGSVPARDPLAGQAQYLCGLALVSLGDDARALVALRKAVYLDAGAGLAHFLLAGALQRTGDAPAARREYRAAASTLAARDATAPELGGRGLAELVTLCLRLSDDHDEADA